MQIEKNSSLEASNWPKNEKKIEQIRMQYKIEP